MENKVKYDKWQFWDNKIAYPPNIIGDSPIKNMMVRNTQGKQSLFCHITFSKPLETTFAFINNNKIKSYNNNDLVMMKENKKFALLIARTVGM